MDPNTPLQPYVPPAGTSPAASGVPSGPAAPATGLGQAPPFAPLNPIAPGTGVPAPSAGGGVSGSVFPPADPFTVGGPLPANVPAQGSDVPTNPRTELVQRLAQANNVLVTVSNNPSVDQLASAVGLTLLLNKLDKHATAVFSGEVPSTLEFLQPDKTIEKNTDSLRDFIIALDKSKADKLRYKVEDKFVKIFITPYHTSLSEDDLEFSQGDFNVDVVVALGVHKREELDQAITAHGRILHDAVVASVNNKQSGTDLGAINWFEGTASSLCEMVVGLIEPLQGNKALLDEQIATAFLTGVVAETERFSNDKTTPHTMTVAATLMKAGANQQLVASKLQEPAVVPQAKPQAAAAPTPAKSNDGSLAIQHDKNEQKSEGKSLDELDADNKAKSDDEDDTASGLDKIHIDDNGQLQRIAELEEKPKDDQKSAEAPKPASSNMILEPPTLGGALSANTKPEVTPPPVDPLTNTVTSASQEPEVSSMQHGKPLQPLTDQEKGQVQTLSQLEQAVGSPHAAGAQSAADVAREQISSIENQLQPEKPEPVAALNAQPIDLGQPAPAAPITPPTPTAAPPTAPVFPAQIVPPDTGPPPDPTAGTSTPTAPPPVPPPLIPPDA